MLEKKLLDTMAIVLEIPRETIDESISAETCDSWDSMNHMNLILALEEEFGVRIPDDDAVDLINFKDLCAYLKTKVK